MPRTSTLILAFFVSASAYGSTLPEPVQAALAGLAGGSEQAWAYTRETRDDKGHYLERFDPTLPHDQQWQLLAFGGEQPTDAQLKRYRKDYDDLFKRDSPAGFDLEGLIDPATIAEHSRSGDSIVYEFRPGAEDAEDAEDEKFVQHLRGTIVIDVPDNRVRSVSIRNLDKFSPIAMLRITLVSLDFEFAPVSEDGPVFLVAARSATEGSFMRIKKLSEKQTVDYRDFELRD